MERSILNKAVELDKQIKQTEQALNHVNKALTAKNADPNITLAYYDMYTDTPQNVIITDVIACAIALKEIKIRLLQKLDGLKQEFHKL